MVSEAGAVSSVNPPEIFDGDYRLPCDVKLPPNTVIGKGCRLSTLMHALALREGQDLPRFLADPAAILAQIREKEAKQ